MKITKLLAISAGMAALAACSGGAEDNTANADANMAMEENLDMNMGNTDMNAMNDMGNVTVNADNVTVVDNATDANATATNNTM